MELRDRVGLVTGAGRRVGQAIAVALGARGMRVAVHFNRSSAGANETVARINAAGGAAEAFEEDLADPSTPERLIARVAGRFGAIDVLVNSAAIMRRTPFGQVTPAAWDEIMGLNLRAPFFLSQAAAPHLARGTGGSGGAIVNIADLAAFETWPAYVPHGVSKGGIVNLTRALARTLAPAIRVNAVAPGTVLLPENWTEEATEHLRETTPLGRLGDPSDVARAVIFLLESDYITGETIIVDGGRHVRH
ncbi:MAG TPA: SDR family oxidoreductase [Gemmatimonadaceae bacterium]|nr:SDR family oxidoreductase [Gemmatimonadaceae bacterium]